MFWAMLPACPTCPLLPAFKKKKPTRNTFKIIAFYINALKKFYPLTQWRSELFAFCPLCLHLQWRQGCCGRPWLGVGEQRAGGSTGAEKARKKELDFFV